ncbi:hypothetical protein B4U37_07270 [Sutcliffiella horikoshii]|uniref:DUF4926 domain-containing protein n=1 Tax=Sutcliffiella horikoshii TaxID=79883 RepID=A0ABM6KH62_9BACI|nr:hypothetical protein [Sutcliffiella horikoshii]ART75841.1 hypothetical protein B4U37_07270 [Sutcliffiella horikoshii]
MNFSQILAQYIDRAVEVYLPNQTPFGRLRSVSSESFVVEVQNGSYVTPTELVTIFLDNVQGVRVIDELNL